MHVESRFYAGAVSQGNYGVMQINRSNFRVINSDFQRQMDFLDFNDNVLAGVHWLAGIQANNHNDIHLELAIWNMGGNRALQLWRNGTRSTSFTRAVIEFKERIEPAEDN